MIPLLAGASQNSALIEMLGDPVQGPSLPIAELLHFLDRELLADMGHEPPVLELPSVPGQGGNFGLAGDAVKLQSLDDGSLGPARNLRDLGRRVLFLYEKGLQNSGVFGRFGEEMVNEDRKMSAFWLLFTYCASAPTIKKSDN